jgi:hypothetical protein
MNNKIACIDFFIIGMLCLLCILENRIFIFVYWEHLLVTFLFDNLLCIITCLTLG